MNRRLADIITVDQAKSRFSRAKCPLERLALWAQVEADTFLMLATANISSTNRHYFWATRGMPAYDRTEVGLIWSSKEKLEEVWPRTRLKM